MNQITEEQKGKKGSHQTTFYIKADLFKLNNKVSNEKWGELLVLWETFGVLKWMPAYIRKTFPRREAEARAIGLLKEVEEEVDLLGIGNEEKDSEGDLDLI